MQPVPPATPTPAPPPANQPWLVRSLAPADLAAFRAHLLSLDADARRCRFGTAVRDEYILACAEGLLAKGVSLGAFNRETGSLVGIVTMVPISASQAELAISLDEAARGVGLGHRLLDDMLRLAAEDGFSVMEINYLAANIAMRRLTRRLVGRRTIEGVDVQLAVDLAAYRVEAKAA